MPSDKRLAKKKLDNLSFFGSFIEVSYYPQAENREETKEKLDRRLELVKNYKKRTAPRPPQGPEIHPTPDLLGENKVLQMTGKRPLAPPPIVVSHSRSQRPRLRQPVFARKKKRIDLDPA